MPIIATETSVITRMDLAYKWLMFLLSAITDMFYSSSTDDDGDPSNKQLLMVVASHALVWAWMMWFFVMTTLTVTLFYIDWSSISILVWLHGLAAQKYLQLQEILPSVVKGFVQCVCWQLQQNYGHISTSLSSHGVTNQCTFVVKPNTSSRCEYKSLQMNQQSGPVLLLQPTAGEIPCSSMMKSTMLDLITINTYFIQ